MEAMEIKEIQKLLEKFYEGQSSPEEETILRTFFLNKEVPVGLEPDRLYFETMETGKRESRPEESQSSDILQAIKVSEPDLLESDSKIARFYPWISAAAGLVLVLGTYFFLSHQQPKDTYNDPQLAYMEAKKVLYYVSSTLNNGTRHLDVIQKTNQKIAPLQKMEVVNRAMNEMKKISEISDQVDKLKPLDRLQDPKNIISNYTKK